MEEFIREALRVAGELGLTPWERIALILAIALLIVSGRRLLGPLWKHLRSIEIRESEPSPPMDHPEGGISVPGSPPDKEWEP